METQHHGHDPDAPAWYMSLWFLLILILVIAVLTIWFTFARNAASEQQVQVSTETTSLPQARLLPPAEPNGRAAVWALRIQRGGTWQDAGAAPAPPVTLS